MASISTAVGAERRSRTSGYKIKKGFFSNDTPNLPQLIAVFGEANTANQSGLTTAKREITSAKEAAELYGYGSPIHQQMRILRPASGDGVGGIPTIVFPQISDVGATATVRSWTVVGNATSNATHYVIVNGRDGLDFQTYAYSVVSGDTPTIIAGKMSDAVNSVLGTPAIGTHALGVATFTTKWKGSTSAQLNIVIDFGNNAAGVSYSQTTSTDGAGVVSLASSLAQFGDDWYTMVTNPYGTAQLDALEAFNGIPDPDAPTGRYSGLIFKPFMAYFGSVLQDKDDLALITDDSYRVDQVTNVLCPAPNSKGFDCEAVANAVTLFARIAQDSPHLDVNAKAYSDMPIPSDGNIGDMSDYNNRDFLVKKGCSTVMLENGYYKVQDFVTTYHPDGEVPLQYAYARNLNLDWNVSYGYRLLETRFLKDKTLVRDNQNVDVAGAIKPKEWKAIIFGFSDDLASRGLINEPQFTKDSLLVKISETNPDRFETFFRYKRTGIARIESTDVEAGF
jgi:phage tail sheath gpL-like